MYGRYTINKKSLYQIKEKLSWQGSGKQSDPVTIDSIKDLNEKVKIKNINTFILIKDITLCEIFLTKCRNLTLDNCEIYSLKFTACQKITIKNCSIVHGNLQYCRGCSFQNNVLHPDYAAYMISDAGTKIGDNTMKYLQRLYLIPFIILILISILALIFKNFIIGIGFLLTSMIPLSPIIDMRIKKSFVKDLGPNKFENNRFDILEDLYLKYKDFVI